MKHLLITLCLISAMGVIASPIDLTQIDGKEWNPRDTYPTGNDNDTWNINQFGSSGINFALREGSNFAPSGYEAVFNVTAPTGANLDAWLCSPSFIMKKGYTYEVKFSYRYTSSVSKISMSCWLDNRKATENSEIATVISKTPPMTKNNSYPTAWTEISFTYTPEEDETSFINWQAYASQYAESTGLLYIGQFHVKIISSQAQPQPPTGVVAEPGADGEIKSVISWNLPTLNIGGEPLTGENSIENIYVYRDGNHVATLPGDAISWTDTERSGLTKGNHSYQIAAVAAGEIGILSDPSDTIYVGPFLYAPLTMEFSDDQWTCYKIAGQAFVSNATYVEPPYTNAASIWAYTAVAEDAWLCSPAIRLESDKTYKVRFNYLTWDDSEFIVEHMDIYAAGSRADENSATRILETDPIYTLENIRHSLPRWKTVEIDGVKGREGMTHILFHVTGKVCKRFSITAFEVEEYADRPFSPAAPSYLTATKAPYQQLEVRLTWKNPTTSSDGTPLAEGQTIDAVKIIRDGETIYTSTESITEFIDSDLYELTPGKHDYAVAARIDEIWSLPSDITTIEYVGAPPVQALPWKPELAALTSEEFSHWWISYPDTETPKWMAGATGIRFINPTGALEDCWLIGAPLQIDNPATAYRLDYRIETDNPEETVISIGLVDTTMPENFSHLITDNATFGQNISTGFYLTPGRQMSAPRLALRAHSPSGKRTATLTQIELYADDLTGIGQISDSMVSEILVFDLSGRSLGSAESLRLDGFDPGIYIVSYVYEGKSSRRKIVK